MPEISIVMPAYNAEKTIGEAIDSVLSQTFSDFELIVINDCSKDSTSIILSDYANNDKRVKVFTNEVNSGVSKTRNFGIEKAEGKWIAFLDSDDVWREDKLEKQVALMRDNNAVISYTASAFIDEYGNRYSYIMPAEKTTDYKTLLRKNLISCSSAMVRADVMKKYTMPNDNMHEDYYVWLNILKSEKYAYGINEPLLIYRLSKSSKSGSRLKSAKMSYNTYRAIGYNPITTIIRMAIYTKHSFSKRSKIHSSALSE